ncbi:MAG: hypothetical protein QXU81_08250 [Candidatus Bathyarchaeia archaeon]
MQVEERKGIAKDVKEKGFPIDAWVTAGEMRLIRLPYSLNGLVSRIVFPLESNEIEGFNPIAIIDVSKFFEASQLLAQFYFFLTSLAFFSFFW